MNILTDQEFTYRETPVSYDGLAKFDSIKGNTLVWNQKCRPLASTYWTASNGTASWNSNSVTVTNTGTSTFGIYLKSAYRDLKAGHKLLFECSITSSADGTIEIGFDDTPTETYTANRLTKVSKFVTLSADNKAVVVYRKGDTTVGDTIKVDNLIIFDLTVMFGAGSEPSTVEEFTSLFPLPYYAYDTGSLLNFNGTGIKTTGKNLSDVGNILSTNTGYVNKSTSILGYAIKGYTYTVSFKNLTTLASYFKVRITPEGTSENVDQISKNLVASGKCTFTFTASDTGSIWLSGQVSGYTSVKVFDDVQLEFGTGTAYEPYKTETALLPIADYFPTGMKSAGDVYDELTPSKAITRVGTRAYQNGDENDPSVITDGTNTNYALPTPTESDGVAIEYIFYKGGTEEILPGTSAPILANIVYYNLTEGETPYRKFWIVNAKGDRWNMTEMEEKSFLNNPQGLGYAKSLSTIRYGNRQNLTDVTDNFPQPSGEILFYDSANSSRYERYNEFVRFLSYYPITLYYQIPVSYYSHIQNIYTLDCVVGSLTKTESKTDGILRCSITFNALSFYKGDTVTISGSGSTYTITNDGDFPVGFEITIEGSPVNPYVQLEQDNELYGEAKFIDSTAFDSVYVNSNDGEQNVILEQGGSVLPNPLSYQDLSISNGSIYVTFVKLARGESDLTIGMDSGSLTSVEIRFTPIYRSV